VIIHLRRFVCLSLLFSPLTLAAQVSFRLSSIARLGDPAPVPPELVEPSSALVNNAGQVAFNGDGALFLNSNGTTMLVAAPGDPAPGGGYLTSVGLSSLNAQGQIAFVGYRYPLGGIYLADGKAIRQLVASGDPAPGGGQFFSFSLVSLNASGQAAFIASTFDRQGLFLLSDGSIAPVALEGQPAPGGDAFRYVYAAALNGAGQIAFTAGLNPTGLGLFLYTDGSIVRIVRDGDPAPAGGTFDQLPAPVNTPERRAFETDLSGGATYGSVSALSINDQGQIAFAASTVPADRGGIFLFSDGQLTREVGELDPAPGGGFLYGLSSPSLNATGQIAFYASLPGPGTGVFLLSQGSVSLVARPPQLAPEGDPFSGASSPSLNDGGQVAFIGEFRNRLAGVYLFSAEGISRIAGPGDPIDRKPTFRSAAAQAINAEGVVLFGGSSFPGGYGLFKGANLVVRVGAPAPGGGVFTPLGSFQATTVQDQVAFRARTTLGRFGIFLAADDVLTRIAAEGEPAPGGGTFSLPDVPAINNRGEIAFAAMLFPTSLGYGLFSFSKEQSQRLLATGDPAPGGGSFLFFFSASLNDVGQLAFLASTAPTGRWGIYLWSEGSAQTIAESGGPAPGGGTFDFDSPAPIFAPSLNHPGQVAFAARLSTGNSGLFLFSDRVIRSIVRPGDPVPGGGTFDWADSPSLNEVGQLAFRALGPTGIGAYLYTGGSIVKVVAPGDPAPGGGTFTYAAASMLNAQGLIAFTGALPEGSGAFLATPIR